MTHHQVETPGTANTPNLTSKGMKQYGLLLLVVLFASLLGIASRPLDQFTMLWPTNALLLGLFLRNPGLVTPAGWLAAALGYILADLLTGSAWSLAISLNLVNLFSVFIGLSLCVRTVVPERGFTAPESLSRLFLAVVTGATLAGVVGGAALWLLLGLPFWSNMASWAVSELHSYIVLLPSVLTAPALSAWWKRERRSRPAQTVRAQGYKSLPVLSLFATLLATIFIGGPGALAFPVIALLACVLSYSVFTTSLLTLAFSLLAMLSATSGQMPVLPDLDDLNALLSMRLGVASIALAPIAVASVMAARESSLRALRHLAEHDTLTGLLNRRTFHQRANLQLARLAEEWKSVAVLMIDIDHFKRINDTYGHAVGDEVLSVTAARLRESLRSEDLFGRVGGEEFSVLISGCSQAQLEEIAQRIHRATRKEIFLRNYSGSLEVTLSIGATLKYPAPGSLDAMLSKADRALYLAKNSGRNQTRFL